MATTRPFAYNTGSTINGTTQLGSLAIGVDALRYDLDVGGVKWWMGPDESLGYVIAVPAVNQPTDTIPVTAKVGFYVSSSLTDQSFVDLANIIPEVYGITSFTNANQAKTWLNDNGYWTSYGTSVTPTPTPTLTQTPTVTPTKTTTPTPTLTQTPTITPTKTTTPTPTLTQTPTKTLTPTPSSTPPASYLYYRWQITASKTQPPDSNCIQAAEFAFQLNGTDQDITGVVVTNPGGSNPVNETPPKLVDGDLNTKALDLNFVTNGFVSNFVFQFGSARRFNGYRWATANDFESRDPKSWTFAGSNDGSNWTTLSTVTGFNATSARNTWQTAQTY